MTNKDEYAIMAGGFDTVPPAASETLANAWDIFKYNNDARLREIENKAASRDDWQRVRDALWFINNNCVMISKIFRNSQPHDTVLYNEALAICDRNLDDKTGV